MHISLPDHSLGCLSDRCGFVLAEKDELLQRRFEMDIVGAGFWRLAEGVLGLFLGHWLRWEKSYVEVEHELHRG